MLDCFCDLLYSTARSRGGDFILGEEGTAWLGSQLVMRYILAVVDLGFLKGGFCCAQGLYSQKFKTKVKQGHQPLYSSLSNHAISHTLHVFCIKLLYLEYIDLTVQLESLNLTALSQYSKRCKTIGFCETLKYFLINCCMVTALLEYFDLLLHL